MIPLHHVKRPCLSLIGLLLLLCIVCTGCEVPGFARYVIAGPPKIKAVYKLQNQPTLVIVDDPQNLLGDPNFPVVIGANVGFHLKQNKVLDDDLIISQDHLSVLAAQMGNRYLTTPIDQVGQRLHAQQIIHVQVLAVNLDVDNTYYHPMAELEVKVVDATTGQRLFPTVSEDVNPRVNPPGHRFTAELPSQTLEENRRSAVSLLSRRLAERIGLEVAQLFYDHIHPDDVPKT